MRPSKKDVLTFDTKKQFIEHNEFCDKQKNCTEPTFEPQK